MYFYLGPLVQICRAHPVQTEFLSSDLAIMCKITYHHFAACGHISNWTMKSCMYYTHYLRSFPGDLIRCEDAEISHNLTSERDEGLCMRCHDISLTKDLNEVTPSNVYLPIEGLNSEIPPFVVAAQANPDTNIEDFSSPSKFDSKYEEDSNKSRVETKHDQGTPKSLHQEKAQWLILL